MEGRVWGSWEQRDQCKDGGWPARNQKYGRPPHPPGSWATWHSSIPSWEKTFCTEVCLIPWKKICATKSMMCMYKNVVQWDDSAAAEAFQDAKARFWAAINGLPCNIPLPDPDMYIEEVNHKAVIDPQLVADLEKYPPPAPDHNNDAGNGWDSFVFADKPVPVTGWGDADPDPANDNKAERSVNWDVYVEKPVIATGWGDEEDYVPTNGDSGNAWNCSSGWGNGIVQDGSWGSRGKNSWKDGRDNSWGHWDKWNNERVRENGRKRNGGQFGPRFTKPRYQTDDYQTNSSWKNSRERNKEDYLYEKTVHAKQPLSMRQWKSRHSCGPTNYQIPNESGGAWNWEKPIS